jgi:hypothetical protein
LKTCTCGVPLRIKQRLADQRFWLSRSSPGQE